MYMMVKEIVVPISDLRFMAVECSACRTSVSLDMTYTPPLPEPDRLIPTEAPPPNIFQCPVCRAMFDSRVGENIKAFRAVYRDLVDHKIQINFRVKGDSAS
jgi:hypothetical protein